MKKTILIIGLVLITAIAGAFIYFKGKRYEVVITQEQVDSAIVEKFPVTKKFLIIFELTLSNPQVQLLEKDNRIQVGLDAALNMKAKGGNKKMSGSCAMTSKVRYDAGTHEFYLTDSQVDRLEIEGIPEKYLEKVSQAASAAAEKYLEDFSVYKLEGEDGKMAAARLLLKDLQIRDHKIYVVLGL